MKKKPLQIYLINGIAFANKNLDLFLIGLALLSVSTFITYVKAIPFAGVISILLSLIEFGYVFSIPLFLSYRQQKKKLDKETLISTTWKNTKRLIWPLILLYIALIGLLMVAGLLFVVTHPGQKDAEQMINFFFKSGLIQAVISFTMPISVFTSFFFSLEDNEFFTALSKGIWYCLKNIPLYGVFFVIGFLTALLQTIVDITNPLFLLLTFGINYYATFILIASGLLYYQANPLKNNK